MADFKQQKNTQEPKEVRIFLNNAFFLLAHRDRIMSDCQMFLASVPVENGPISFGKLCLGVYIEWWLSYDTVRRVSEDGRLSLVFRLAGSPCSGRNSCNEVYEDGSNKVVHISNFMNAVGRLKRISEHYSRYDNKERYSLEEVVEILKKEDNENKSYVQDYTALFQTTT
jgi:hypothetical protein